MQERLEASAAGRIVISLFIVLVLVAVVSWNLPDSEIKRRAVTGLSPFVNGVGLDQNWGVFAPNPPRDLVVLQVRIAYRDGSQRTWLLPRGDRVLDPYWDYRWRKYAEWVPDDNRKALWEPTARWVARQEQAEGRRPVTVTLARKVTRLNPPGTHPLDGEPKTTDFYTYSVTPVATGTAARP